MWSPNSNLNLLTTQYCYLRTWSYWCTHIFFERNFLIVTFMLFSNLILLAFLNLNIVNLHPCWCLQRKIEKKKISLSLILFFIIIFTNFLFEKKWKNGNLQRVLFCFSSLQKNLSRFYLKNLKIKLIMVKLKSFRLYFWQKNADYSAPSFSRIFTGFFFHSV